MNRPLIPKASPASSRRGYQFGLRTLFVVVNVVAAMSFTAHLMGPRQAVIGWSFFLFTLLLSRALLGVVDTDRRPPSIPRLATVSAWSVFQATFWTVMLVIAIDATGWKPRHQDFGMGFFVGLCLLPFLIAFVAILAALVAWVAGWCLSLPVIGLACVVSKQWKQWLSPRWTAAAAAAVAYASISFSDPYIFVIFGPEPLGPFVPWSIPHALAALIGTLAAAAFAVTIARRCILDEPRATTT